MTQIAYTVIVTITDDAKAQEWRGWLENGHIAAVIAGGANSAEIVKRDNDQQATPGTTYEIRYKFDNRGIFEEYIKTHAPRLREDGLKRFPPEDGFTYSRTVGEIIEGKN